MVWISFIQRQVFHSIASQLITSNLYNRIVRCSSGYLGYGPTHTLNSCSGVRAVVVVDGLGGAAMYELVRVGHKKLEKAFV